MISWLKASEFAFLDLKTFVDVIEISKPKKSFWPYGHFKGTIRMSIFGPGHSAQTEKKSNATRWNANSFETLQKCNSFLQSTLKCHHNIFHEKVAKKIFEIIFLIGLLQ